MSTLRSVILAVLGLAFLYGLFTVGFPFLLAIVIAVFIEPANQMLMRWLRVNRLVAATIMSTVVVLLIVLLLFLIGLKIFTEMAALFQKLPMYIKSASAYIQNDLIEMTRGMAGDLLDEEQIAELLSGLTDQLTGVISRLADVLGSSAFSFAGVLSNLFIFFLVFAVAIYLFSYSLPVLKSSFLNLFAEESQGKVDRVLQDLRNSIFGFLKSQIILSTMTYIITLLGLLILNVNYAMAIALLIIIVDLLPILGTGSFIVPWAIYNAATGNLSLAIGLFILFLVITVIRRVVEPKILGDAVGIGALPALVSLYIGFKLVGVIGFFLGPLVVIVYQAMRRVGLLEFKIRLE